MTEQEAQRLANKPWLKYLGNEPDEDSDVEKKHALEEKIAAQSKKLEELIERRNWLSVSQTEDAL
jgi:hypothetical protein